MKSKEYYKAYRLRNHSQHTIHAKLDRILELLGDKPESANFKINTPKIQAASNPIGITKTILESNTLNPMPIRRCQAANCQSHDTCPCLVNEMMAYLCEEHRPTS